LFYALPFHPQNKFTFFSQKYVYPFFHQNWNLFAPVPDSNYHLLVRYQKNGSQTKDILNEIVLKHQSNRFAGIGPLVLAFSNSIHYFEKNTNRLEKLNGPISGNEYFEIIEHEAYNYLVNSEKINAQRVKVFLIVDNVASHQRRIYFN
jgi:hypothetical protein